jgi:hypothetical protein
MPFVLKREHYSYGGHTRVQGTFTIHRLLGVGSSEGLA